MDAKEAALVAKKYFAETKSTIYFLFDAPNVRRMNGQWKVDCEIKELFEQPRVQKFELTIDDKDGAILDVKRLDQSG
jgi:hypothetical protein